MLSRNESIDASSIQSESIGQLSSSVRLRLRKDGTVISGDAGAAVLLSGVIVPGKPLEVLLDEAEKSGVLAGGTGNALIAALARRSPEHLFDMRDGRSILVAFDYAAVDVTLSFTDVSYVVQVTLSRQRDVLTGLPNRLALVRRLEDHVDFASANVRTALLYIDLDRFKLVNDTLGHPIGDMLLKLVSERLSRLLGPEDLLVRLGGDEFVVLQENADQPYAAEALASRIVDMVGRTYLIQGHSVEVGASVGIALAETDGRTPEELIRNADLALFRAKSDGRSTFRFFTETMGQEVQARRSMEIDLRRALVLEQFSLVYQPQFEIEGNRLVGFEALVRWTTPERGPVSPAQFIPLAEETGLIGALGEWVLRTACRDAAEWPEPISVSVNLSPVQFKNSRLVETVVSALASSGLPPSKLDLEITEGTLMQETDAVLSTLRKIKALGIKVSMDDFGTGYSSLSYLQKFPFDKIKIDQSFIRSLGTDGDSAAIVRAITALGDSLGMTTIAEGVETESQLLQVAKDGCKQVQGYLTGRPMPSQEAASLIGSKNTDGGRSDVIVPPRIF